MRLKSYFANTVEGALSLARQELGPEALLMKTGPAMPEARYLGAYEVVFAAPEPAAGVEPVSKPPAGETLSSPVLEKLMSDVAGLRRQLERAASTAALTGGYPAAFAGAGADVQQMAVRLQQAGVSPDSATRIMNRMLVDRLPVDRMPGQNQHPPRSLEQAIAEEMAAATGTPANLAAGRVVAMVGPPGAGKTTTLVKLAVSRGLGCRRPVQILTADLYRIAAAEQLRSYAAILGVGFETAETAVLLARQLEEHRQKDLILIDTPGYGAREMDAGAEWAEFFSSHPEIDVHLVLSATAKTADLIAAADRYAAFRPSKLVLTRCDETESFGQIIDLCFHTGLPVSHLGTGQQIPEDIESAGNARLARMVLRGETEAELEESAWAAA